MQTDDAGPTLSAWRERAAALRWSLGPLVDGKLSPSSGSGVYRRIHPASDLVLYEAGEGADGDVDLAVASARKAFESGVWSARSPHGRRAVLLKLAELIEQNHEELALRDTLEMGKPITAALFDARIFAPHVCRFYAEAGDKLYGDVAGSDAASLAFAIREPRGIVGAIVPWNYPVVNAVLKIAPALVTGNCLVLKPSELASTSALRVAELALEAGVPEGVLNVVTGLGVTVGAALARHRDVDHITFTGSTATGRTIMRLAAESNGKPIMLECGGKSPQIVFADAPDPAFVAARVARDILTNQGQVCVARSRLIVQESIKDALLAELSKAMVDVAIGDPLDPHVTFGPLASGAQRDRVLGYIGLANRESAQVMLGGRQWGGREGCYVEPTLICGVSPDSQLVRDEIFGPVLTVQTFETADEALTLANRTAYGLSATVWTRDYPTAHKFVRGLRTGHVDIKTCARDVEGPGLSLASEPRHASGFGGETGLEGLRNYTMLKGVVIGAE